MEKLRLAKAKLQEAYDEISEEELDVMIQQVEKADEHNRRGNSWKLINRIPERKMQGEEY